jgi:hypothetical protein
VLSVLLWFTDSDYPFGIFWPLCCLSFFDLPILITPLVSFGHCVVCPSLIYGFWLPLLYLQTLHWVLFVYICLNQRSPLAIFFSVFVSFLCGVRHSYDGICKITFLIFCFLVDYPALFYFTSIHEFITKL